MVTLTLSPGVVEPAWPWAMESAKKNILAMGNAPGLISEEDNEALKEEIKTIAEQDVQIKELKKQVSFLESLLKNQDKIKAAQELVVFVQDYPEKLDQAMVVSTDIH